MTTARGEHRRGRIISAAYELIAEVGIGRLTHRLVAARAEVPLGLTTYYFKSLDDLVLAALADAFPEQVLRMWTEAIETADDLPDTLARLAADYARERKRALVETELYLAAAHNPGLRALARLWTEHLLVALSTRLDPAAARAMITLIDGAVLEALVFDEPVDTEQLRVSLAALGDIKIRDARP